MTVLQSLVVAFLVVDAACIAAFAYGRWRVRLLRRIARSRQRTMFVAHIAIRIGIPVVLIGLLARGCLDEHRPVRALVDTCNVYVLLGGHVSWRAGHETPWLWRIGCTGST